MAKNKCIVKTEVGDRILIPASCVEFRVGGNTIWIQSPQGATLLRIKTKKKISVKNCNNNPVSHGDMVVEDDIEICLADDTEVN